MADDPFYLKLLEKLGVNTTRLRWKLYRMEERAKHTKEHGATPTFLRWLQYPHKICGHCGAVADRADRECPRCQKRMPSMAVYRLLRIIGILVPQGAPAVVYGFLGVILAIFSMSFFFDGPEAIGGPSDRVYWAFGALSSYHDVFGRDWWRLFAFGLSHGGLWHFAFNVYAISQVGPIVENNVGRQRMLAVITITQVTSWLATYIWYNAVVGTGYGIVGASGWALGLIGYGIAQFHYLGGSFMGYRDSLIRWVAIILVFGFIVNFSGMGFRVGNAAHIGGLAGGLLLGRVAEGRRRAIPALDVAWKVAFWVSLVVWVVVLGYIIASVGVNWELLRQGVER